MKRVDPWLILVGGMVLFTLSLTPEFIGLEARFALFAQEMLRNGPTYFPTTYGQPYPDYPATATLLTWLLSGVSGRVTPFTLVFPSALASALVLVVIYRLGALHSRRWGWIAVLLALMTHEFFAESRSASPDQFTSLCGITCLWLAYSSDRLGQRERLGFLPALWVLGFSFRGPIGLVVPAAMTGAYYLWEKRWKPLLLIGGAGTVLLAACMGILLLAAEAQAGGAFAREVLAAEFTGRLLEGGVGPFYYAYRSLGSYALAYPLAILVLAARFKAALRRESEADRLLGILACAALVVLVGLSFPATKKMRYLLPVVPCIALIAAYPLAVACAGARMAAIRRGFLVLCRILPVLAAAGCIAFYVYMPTIHQARGAGFLILPLLLLLLSAASVTFLRAEGACLALGLLAFLIGEIAVAEHVQDGLEETRTFARGLEILLEESPGELYFLGMGPDEEDIKLAANCAEPIRPGFIRTLGDLPGSERKQYLIAEERTYRSLERDYGRRLGLQLRGQIGHKKCVAFVVRERPRGF